MYGTMILLHIRTNYYFCWCYWCIKRHLTRIYRIISGRRVGKKFNDNFFRFLKLYDKKYNMERLAWEWSLIAWRIATVSAFLSSLVRERYFVSVLVLSFTVSFLCGGQIRCMVVPAIRLTAWGEKCMIVVVGDVTRMLVAAAIYKNDLLVNVCILWWG